MDGNTCVLVGVFSVLGSDGVLLGGHWLASVDATILEYHGSITKDEVHGAINVTFSEELAIGVNIECVLEPNDIAPIDHGVVSTNSERHCLVIAWTSRILKSHVSSDETCSGCRCMHESRT